MNNNMMALWQGVQQFRQMNPNKDPDQIINQLVQSGKVSQAQYNQARQMGEMFMQMINPGAQGKS